MPLDAPVIQATRQFAGRSTLDHDDLGFTEPQVINVMDSKRLSMMSPENRCTLFGIML